MKKKIYIFVAFATLISACNFFGSGYGKRIEISDKLEVFIKGDSTTEQDAKKLGTYLDTTWKDITHKRSFQLIKEKGEYNIGMVVDETLLKKDSTLDDSFKALRLLIAMSVFPENKVNLILTNDTFKPYKTYKEEPEATETVKPELPVEEPTKK